jgi:hypothetical protein
VGVILYPGTSSENVSRGHGPQIVHEILTYNVYGIRDVNDILII